MDANKRQISEIFSRHRLLEIPFFQRSYVWDEEQWQRFLEDMKHISDMPESKSYFFGSLIFKQKETPTSNEIDAIRTVIDGQQRLTTLIIFFKALSLAKNDPKIFEIFKIELEGGDQVALQHNYSDIDSFQKISELNVGDNIPEKETPDKILNAFKFFQNNADDLKEISHTAIRKRAIFIVIDLSKDEDEQQIFDTLNSLGVRLTTAELLKNYLFRREDTKLYEENWRDVFERGDEAKLYWDKPIYAGRQWRTFTDVFFYAYLQLKAQEHGEKIKSKDREEFSRWENLFLSYKKFIEYYDIDKRAFSEDIKNYAARFRKNFDSEVVDRALSAELNMQRINAIIFGLEVSTLIPYVLFIISEVEDEKQKQELFEGIESFVLRRLVVRSNNRGYNQLFLGMIADRVLTKDEFYARVNKRSDMVNALPSDSELEKGFHELALTNKSAKGVLYFIESRIRSNKHSTALLGMKKYSLEHLMPKKWQNHWGTLNEQEAEVRDKKLLTLGNLALITSKLNTSIRDAAWQTKRDGRDNDGLKAYATAMEVHKSFLEADQWNEDKIKSRAEDLFGEAKNIWATK